jgi:hypothetical protein
MIAENTDEAEKQAWPNHNWCVGCDPDNCSGCGIEPQERRTNPQEVIVNRRSSTCS